MTALGWGTSRRSFFLFIIPVRDSPCDLKCNVDCSAKQRKQHYDLFKRHGASPLSALGRPGEAEISRKIRSTGHSGAGKEHAATATTAASGRNREELLGQRPARRKYRPRYEADAGCRNSCCICGTQRLVAALRLRLKHTIIMCQLQLRLFCTLIRLPGGRVIFSTHSGLPLRPYSR